MLRVVVTIGTFRRVGYLSLDDIYELSQMSHSYTDERVEIVMRDRMSRKASILLRICAYDQVKGAEEWTFPTRFFQPLDDNDGAFGDCYSVTFYTLRPKGADKDVVAFERNLFRAVCMPDTVTVDEVVPRGVDATKWFKMLTEHYVEQNVDTGAFNVILERMGMNQDELKTERRKRIERDIEHHEACLKRLKGVFL